MDRPSFKGRADFGFTLCEAGKCARDKSIVHVRSHCTLFGYKSQLVIVYLHPVGAKIVSSFRTSFLRLLGGGGERHSIAKSYSPSVCAPSFIICSVMRSMDGSIAVTMRLIDASSRISSTIASSADNASAILGPYSFRQLFIVQTSPVNEAISDLNRAKQSPMTNEIARTPVCAGEQNSCNTSGKSRIRAHTTRVSTTIDGGIPRLAKTKKSKKAVSSGTTNRALFIEFLRS